jgi:hypothetical protein
VFRHFGCGVSRAVKFQNLVMCVFGLVIAWWAGPTDASLEAQGIISGVGGALFLSGVASHLWEQRRQKIAAAEIDLAQPATESWRDIAAWNDPQGIPDAVSAAAGDVRARFIPDKIPVSLDGELAGMIAVSSHFRVVKATRVTFHCERTDLYRSINKDGFERGARPRSTTLNDTVEQSYAPEEWVFTGDCSRLTIRLPVRGGTASTLGGLTEDSPTVRWLLEVEGTTAAGGRTISFEVPVFADTEVSSPTSSPPSAQAAEGAHTGPMAETENTSAPLPPTPVSPVQSVREDLVDERSFAAAGIEVVPCTGATGGDALVMNSTVGRWGRALPWLSAALGCSLFMLFGGLGFLFLMMIPVVGRFLGLVEFGATLALCGWALVSAWRESRSPVRRLWVESDGVMVARANSDIDRFERDEVDRLEIETAGSSGKLQLFRLVAAAQPAPGKIVRKRRIMVGAIRSFGATEAVGQWLGQRLSPPRVIATKSDGMIRVSERLEQWFGIGRK